MATKLIIVYPISDSRSIPAMGRFRHSLKHHAHIWDEREYDTASESDMKDFNETILPALSLFADRLPRTIVRSIYEVPVENTEPEYTPEPSSEEPPKRRGRPRKELAIA